MNTVQGIYITTPFCSMKTNVCFCLRAINAVDLLMKWPHSLSGDIFSESVIVMDSEHVMYFITIGQTF